MYVTPTTNRSVLVGPTAVNHDDRDNRRTDAETLDWIMERGQRLVPSISPANAIKVFAANRPAGDPVYRVERDERVTNLVQAAGDPLDRRVVLAGGGRARARSAGRGRRCRREDRRDAIRAIEPVPRLLGHTRPEELVALDPRYGQVICACEQVTAAEIAAAFAMRVAPRTVDAVRKRTRATGGRCQGAYCMAGVSFLCSAYGGLRPGRGVAVTVAIVGAGVTGLACAAALGRSAVVVDRIPVCGGVLGFDHAHTRRLESAARDAGAVLHLGETAITWDGAELRHGRPGRRPAHPRAARW